MLLLGCSMDSSKPTWAILSMLWTTPRLCTRNRIHVSIWSAPVVSIHHRRRWATWSSSRTRPPSYKAPSTPVPTPCSSVSRRAPTSLCRRFRWKSIRSNNSNPRRLGCLPLTIEHIKFPIVLSNIKPRGQFVIHPQLVPINVVNSTFSNCSNCHQSLYDYYATFICF